MSIKLFGALPLAAYALPSPLNAAASKTSSTPAANTTNKATSTGTTTTAAKSSGNTSPVTTAAKSTGTTSTATTAAKTTGTPASLALASKTSPGTIYTSTGQLLSTAPIIGSLINVSVGTTISGGTSVSPVNKTTASQSQTATPTDALTANEQILLAKQMYDGFAKLGDKEGMTAASELAEQARRNGGTVSSNVTLDEARVMVANEKIVQAKLDYETAASSGNTAGKQAAIEAAEQARQNGGTIASTATLEQAKTVLANQQIVQAKLDYKAAEEKGNAADMKAAREAAEQARQNGGTISNQVTLQDAQRILEQSKWNGIDPDSPMDFISAEDEAALMKSARKNEAIYGVDAQVAKLDELIAVMEELLVISEDIVSTRKSTMETVAKLKEDIQAEIEKFKQVGEIIDKLQAEYARTLSYVNDVLTRAEERMGSRNLSGSQGLKLAESIYAACEVDAMLKEAEEQRGTVIGEAMKGFLTGIWTSLDETIDYVFYAIEEPKAAGEQAKEGLEETAQAIWNKVSDPNATYEDAKQSVQDFMDLSYEERAYAMGYLLSGLSPSRRSDLLTPNKNKDDGASGVGGNNSSDGSTGNSGVGRNDGANANSSGAVEGNGTARRQTVTSNLGKEIDITPSATHTTTTKNPGYKGDPNTSMDILDSKGEVTTRRWFGPDGKATRDVDFDDHGNPKQHPEAPHEHIWTYGEDGKPTGR